jgi:mannitol-1-phosphate 5-dehydrogenase
VEPFYEWILERPEMKGNLPEIAAIHYVDSLDPYIERKLFTVNTGHCSAAYLGYIEGYQTIQEVMRNPKIREKVCRVLQETGELLIKKYHFDKDQHSRYIQKVLHRFSNQSLTDKIVRVGRNPIQKLSPNERLVRPSMQAYENGLDTPNLNSVMAAALLFDYNQDDQATELQTTIEHDGVQSAITTFTGIPNRHPLHKKVLSKYRTLLAIQSH